MFQGGGQVNGIGRFPRSAFAADEGYDLGHNLKIRKNRIPDIGYQMADKKQKLHSRDLISAIRYLDWTIDVEALEVIGYAAY